MINTRTQIKLTMALGVASLLAGVLGHLALTDIYHQEADVSLEWHIVQVCTLVFLTFTCSALFTLRRVLRLSDDIPCRSQSTKRRL